jgi:hypothetical protein
MEDYRKRVTILLCRSGKYYFGNCGDSYRAIPDYVWCGRLKSRLEDGSIPDVIWLMCEPIVIGFIILGVFLR